MILRTFFVLSLVVLSACSNNSELVIRADNLEVQSGDGNFGIMEEGATVADRILTIIKGQTADTTVTPLASDAFFVASSTGCNRELKKTSDKCIVKLKFLKNKVVGTYESSLVIGSMVIPLSAEVTSKEPEEASSSTISVTVDDEEQSSVNFGVLKTKESLIKILKITNISSTTIPVPSSVIGEGFSIVFNGCSSLAKSKSCYLRVEAKPEAVAPVEETAVEGTLSIGTKTVSLFLIHKAQEQEEPVSASLQVLEGTEVVEELNFGEIKTGSSSSKTLAIKNTGSVVVAASSLVPILSNVTDFSVVSNTCSVDLKASRTCYVRISMNSTSGGEKLGSATIGGKVVGLMGSVIAQGQQSQGITFKDLAFKVTTQKGNASSVETKTISENMVVYVGDLEESGVVSIDFTTCSGSGEISLLVESSGEHGLLTNSITGTCADIKTKKYTLSYQEVRAQTLKASVIYGKNIAAIESPVFRAEYNFAKDYLLTMEGSATAWTRFSGVISNNVSYKIFKPRTFKSVVGADPIIPRLTESSREYISGISMGYFDVEAPFEDGGDYWVLSFRVNNGGTHLSGEIEIELPSISSVSAKSYGKMALVVPNPIYSQDGVEVISPSGMNLFGVMDYAVSDTFFIYPMYVKMEVPTRVSCNMISSSTVSREGRTASSGVFDLCQYDEGTKEANVRWHNKNERLPMGITTYAIEGDVSLETSGVLSDFRSYVLKGISYPFMYN